MHTYPEVNFIVTFEAKSDAIERAKQEVLSLLELVAKEATCVSIFFHQAVDNPAKFMLYENWASKEIFEREHSKTPYLQAFIERSQNFMIAPMQLSFWDILHQVNKKI